MKNRRLIFCAGLLWLLALSAHAATLTGTVVAITDGDTLKLLTPDKVQHKVRLSDIDTPERGQPYGKKARQALADKVFRKQVAVETNKTDRYGRIIGRVYLGDRDINAEMVADGMAWVYRKYSRDTRLLELERQAREQGRGLWSLQPDQRIPPWEWRSQKRRKKSERKETGWIQQIQKLLDLLAGQAGSLNHDPGHERQIHFMGVIPGQLTIAG